MNKTLTPYRADATGTGAAYTAGHHRLAVHTTTADLPAHADALLSEGYRLALAAAHDDGPRLRAVYLFTAAAPDRRVELHLPIDRRDPTVPTLAGMSFPAGRFEREMHDLYGVIPENHPLPRRLVRHAGWPAGWYPMRHDAGPAPDFTRDVEPFPFLTVEGPGVYEIPVGPVHAGLIEPGHFRFSVVGETILKLKARLWYVHRGIEKLFEGRTVTAALPLAERISGDTSVGHALAYCRAVEDALGIEMPTEAGRIRAILLELERVYNHVGDIGAICNDVGHGVLNAHALRIRERLLRIAADATGHRLLRGGVLVGSAGIRRVPDLGDLADIGADIAEVVNLALESSLVADRFNGTAVLGAEPARDLGVLGYVARASGIDIDARRDHPMDAAAEPVGALRVPTHSTGDVMARFQQRAAEIQVSIGMIRELAQTVSPGVVEGHPVRQAVVPDGTRASGVGIVEGWRGTIVHRVEIEGNGRVGRVKIVDPSFFNWPAVPVALTETIVPDFPLANKSFNLSYAGNDL